LADLTFRFPTDSDWPHILCLANESVRHVPGAGDQNAWLANRREFPSERCREHFVAIENDEIAGYAAMEELPGDNLRFRLFLVTLQSARSNVGERMILRLLALLEACAAAEARFVEYSADGAFLEFLKRYGFSAGGRVAVGSVDAVSLVRRPPFSDRAIKQ
jgi:hypothetical protein